MKTPGSSQAMALLSQETINAQSHSLEKQIKLGSHSVFSVNEEAFNNFAAGVCEHMKRKYPDNQFLPHGCWRYLENETFFHWDMIASARQFSSAKEMLVCAADLAILCAVTRTMSPPSWRFQDPVSGLILQGAKAQACAAFCMFSAGSFSNAPSDPFRIDAQALIRLEEDEITSGFQFDPDKDTAFISQLTALLRRLGEVIALRPDVFEQNSEIRPGFVITHHIEKTGKAGVHAPDLLNDCIEALAPLWTGGAVLNQVILGDCWPYSQPHPPETAPELFPFHSPVLEIMHSLLEPLAWAGVEMKGLTDLPGVSDLLHAGLFLNAKVLQVGQNTLAHMSAEQKSDAFVELRCTTLVLMEKLACHIRTHFQACADELPMTAILGSGTVELATSQFIQSPESWDKICEILPHRGVFWLPFEA